MNGICSSPLVNIQHFPNLTNFSVKCQEVFNKHRDLLKQIFYFSLNTAILAQKTIRIIPENVTRWSQFLFNFMVFLDPDFLIRDLKKTLYNFWIAYHFGSPGEKGLALLKTSVKIIDTTLLFSNMTASIIGCIGYNALVRSIYSASRYPGLFSLLADIGLKLWEYRQIKQLIQLLEGSETEKVQRIATDFQQLVLKQKKSTDSCTSLAHKTFSYLPYSVVEKFHEGFQTNKRIESTTIHHLLIKSLNEQKVQMTSDLGLQAISYTTLFIHKFYYDTVLQAAMTWCISSFYLAKKIREKVMHISLLKDLTAES